MKNQWSRRIFLKRKKNVVSPSKQGSEHFFLCLLLRRLVLEERRAPNVRDTRVTGKEAQRSMGKRKERGEISPVFSFPPNLVPRVLSYPSLQTERGTNDQQKFSYKKNNNHTSWVQRFSLMYFRDKSFPISVLTNRIPT